MAYLFTSFYLYLLYFSYMFRCTQMIIGCKSVCITLPHGRRITSNTPVDISTLEDKTTNLGTDRQR